MTFPWEWKRECLKARQERDEAVQRAGSAADDLLSAARFRAAAEIAETNAASTLASVQTARQEQRAEDMRLADTNAAIRQQNYKMRLLLEGVLKRNLPEDEVARIKAAIGEPRPGTEEVPS